MPIDNISWKMKLMLIWGGILTTMQLTHVER